MSKDDPTRTDQRLHPMSRRPKRKRNRTETVTSEIEPSVPVNGAAELHAADRVSEEILPTRSQELQFRMAVHEAGHAVARLHLEIGTIMKITIEAPEGGYVAGTMPGPEEQTEEMLTGILIAGLAGRAAEEVLIKSVVAGSGSERSDLACATELALDMETTMGFSKRWPLLYRKVENPGAILAMDHELAERVHARLASASTVARTMVAAHEGTVDFLGEILMQRKTLEGGELEAVLEQVKHRLAAPPG